MPDKIMYEALETLREYLPKLIAGIKTTIDYFRENREDEGTKLLVQVIDGIQWSVEVVSKTKIILMQYEIIIDDSKLSEILGEFEEALRNKDYVLIADLLEYEIIVLLDEWSFVLNESNLYAN
ncbi:MAG: hypothetical protein ACLKAK_03590 [Alkaliphilus sp.]